MSITGLFSAKWMIAKEVPVHVYLAPAMVGESDVR